MVQRLTRLDVAFLALGAWLVYKIARTIRTRARSTKLRGPPASSWLFGISKETFQGDSGALYEGWSEEYGSVFQVPVAMGARRTVLCDPKAIAHFFSLETYGYQQTPFARIAISNIIGKGLLYAEGDSHKRQRKALTPAFSNAAIRNFTAVFFDSAYKVKASWDAQIEASPSDEAIIEVQAWMNRVSLDSVGIAGFSHDFGALAGRPSAVAQLFDSFGSLKPSALSSVLPLLAPALPLLAKLPTERGRLTKRLHTSMGEIAEVLLRRSRSEKDADGGAGAHSAGQSLIGALIKAENADAEVTLSEDEVQAQMKVLILAGYETTSISLTWALLELAQHPDKQDKLREELSRFSTSDPTYDQLTNALPYLSAVTQEILRLHPALPELVRIAAADDVMPLSTPVMTAAGTTVDRITIAKDTLVTVPIRAMNRATSVWGADAKAFRPERWLGEELAPRAREIQGYHHLLTFVDGPRTCLGKGFAVAEFKSVLSVLVRNYVFALRDGPDTKIEIVRGLLPRPKVAGEEGPRVPLRIRRVE